MAVDPFARTQIDTLGKTMVDPMGKTYFQARTAYEAGLIKPNIPAWNYFADGTFSNQAVAGMNDLAGRINNWGGNLNKKYDLGYRFRSAGKDIASAARFGANVAKVGVTAGAVGAVAGLATGDNYNSTAALRNAVSGAGVAAGGLALGAAGIYAAKHGGARWVGRQAMSATKSLAKRVPGVLGLGARGATAGILGFKHAKYLLAGGALLAAGMWADSKWDRNENPYQFDPTDKDAIATEQQGALRGFQNSATGLAFGLHARRHRG